MRETPESLPYGKYLPDVYRFAFLMTGHADTAADVLRHTVGRATRGGVHDLRNVLQVKHWLFTEARALCANPPPAAPRGDVPPASDPAAPGDPAPATAPPPSANTPLPDVDVPAVAVGNPPRQLATLFADLPETERCALILFYLFLFDPAELSELLRIAPAELGSLLLRGRTLLQRRGSLCENLFAAWTASDAPPAPVADPAASPPPASPANPTALPDAA